MQAKISTIQCDPVQFVDDRAHNGGKESKLKNQFLMRGVALIAIALFFGVQALTYNIGTFANAGAGLFPLLVSSAVLLMGVITVFQARVEDGKQLTFQLKNLMLIMSSLIGFGLISAYINMLLATVFLVFVSSLAAADYSLKRNLAITAVLIAIAFTFRYLLGLQIPLI